MELMQLAILAVINGAVTWGAISAKLKYMERDIENAARWRERHEDLHLQKGL